MIVSIPDLCTLTYYALANSYILKSRMLILLIRKRRRSIILFKLNQHKHFLRYQNVCPVAEERLNQQCLCFYCCVVVFLFLFFCLFVCLFVVVVFFCFFFVFFVCFFFCLFFLFLFFLGGCFAFGLCFIMQC